MSQPAAWDDLTLDERTEHLRSKLATITKAWPHLADPPARAGSGRRTRPGSRIPTHSDALSLRAEITHDLAYWCHALLEDKSDSRDAGPLDLTDTPAMLRHLQSHVRWVAGWEYGRRLAFELADHAHDAAVIAWPRDRDAILLGECPNTIGADGVPVECGAKVRAFTTNIGDVKCPGCGLSDTVDGWILRIVGDQPLVTAEQLVPILHRRLGVVIKPATVRQWKRRGEIVAAAVDHRGRDLFDRQHAMVVVTRREARGGVLA